MGGGGGGGGFVGGQVHEAGSLVYTPHEGPRVTNKNSGKLRVFDLKLQGSHFHLNYFLDKYLIMSNVTIMDPQFTEFITYQNYRL